MFNLQKLSWTAANLVSSAAQRWKLQGAFCEAMMTSLPPSLPPRPVCLHSLLVDVVPYGRQTLPSSICTAELRTLTAANDSFCKLLIYILCV